MRKLPQMLSADEDSGEFEPKGWLLELDTLEQLDIVGDCPDDILFKRYIHGVVF